MFNIFKKKSEKEKLEYQYRSLMAETNRTSLVYRRLADSKIYEADKIKQLIEKMD